MTIERTTINPWTWSIPMGFNQGEVVSGPGRTLYCSGQTATDADGQPQHPGDMAAQLALSLDNLEAVLAARLGTAGATPTTTMLGVSRLAIPILMVELEGTAVA